MEGLQTVSSPSVPLAGTASSGIGTSTKCAPRPGRRVEAGSRACSAVVPDHCGARGLCRRCKERDIVRVPVERRDSVIARRHLGCQIGDEVGAVRRNGCIGDVSRPLALGPLKPDTGISPIVRRICGHGVDRPAGRSPEPFVGCRRLRCGGDRAHGARGLQKLPPRVLRGCRS